MAETIDNDNGKVKRIIMG